LTQIKFEVNPPGALAPRWLGLPAARRGLQDHERRAVPALGDERRRLGPEEGGDELVPRVSVAGAEHRPGRGHEPVPSLQRDDPEPAGVLDAPA
jgi:hypothetical protein